MIKKNTKILFESIEGEEKKEWVGGIPLSRGEIIHIHEDDSNKVIDYVVADKTVDCYIKGDDQIVDVVYILRKEEQNSSKSSKYAKRFNL